MKTIKSIFLTFLFSVATKNVKMFFQAMEIWKYFASLAHLSRM